jgi:hypothetical protein
VVWNGVEVDQGRRPSPLKDLVSTRVKLSTCSKNAGLQLETFQTPLTLQRFGEIPRAMTKQSIRQPIVVTHRAGPGGQRESIRGPGIKRC